MLNILFIFHVPPPIHGSSMIGKYIKDSYAINSVFKSTYINLSTSKTINEIGKNPLIKIIKYLNILFKVIFGLLKFNPDIVYLAITAKGLGFYKDFPIAMLAKLSGKKLILHYHNKGVILRQHKLLDHMLYRILFKNTKVILLSELLYEDVAKYVKKENVFFCPNGIPAPNIVEEILPKINKVPQLLFLSNLIKSKGVFVLLKALKALNDKGIAFHCNIVGGEGDISLIKLNHKINDLNLKNCVTYLGKKYGDDKYKIFQSSDIFVLPTFYHNECFPLVILEAMFHSLGVISTYEGAIPEIIDDNETGYLVEKQDSVDLANKIQQLIENPSLRKSMGEKGRRKFEKKYTLCHFEQNMTKILTKIS